MKVETQQWKGLLPFSLGTAMKLILSCGCFRQRWLDSSSKDLKWSIRPIASEMMIQKCLKLLINDVFLMNWTKISVPKYSSGCLTSSLIKPCLQFHTRMKSSIISTRYEIGWNHTWFDFNQVWNWNHTFSTKSLLLNHTTVLIVSGILTNRGNRSTDCFLKFSFSVFNRILHCWRVTARFGKFSHRHRLVDFKTCLVDKVLSDPIFTVFHCPFCATCWTHTQWKLSV